MNATWRKPLIGCALVLTVVVGLWSARPPFEIRETRLVFGTLVEIVIQHKNRTKAHAAMVHVGHLLQDLHRDWHAWDAGALRSLNNSIGAGQTAQTNDSLADVLRQAKQFACMSSGTFEPAIGGLVALWGFHGDGPEATVPAAAQIETLKHRAPRMADLEISNNAVLSGNRAVQIDLGGVGKGAALDRAVSVLQAHGIENAVLNAGGDVNVMGVYGNRKWRVAIRDPFQWGAVASVAMEPGEAIYTSGNYERFFETGGVRFAHIIDPRTGYPVQGIVSATVLHSNGALADAAATALSVAGPDGWAQVAADMGISQALLMTDDGRALATPEIAARLNFHDRALAEALEVTPLPAPRVYECSKRSSPPASVL